MKMEEDTRAAVSLISMTKYQAFPPDVPIRNSNVILQGNLWISKGIEPETQYDGQKKLLSSPPQSKVSSVFSLYYSICTIVMGIYSRSENEKSRGRLIQRIPLPHVVAAGNVSVLLGRN